MQPNEIFASSLVSKSTSSCLWKQEAVQKVDLLEANSDKNACCLITIWTVWNPFLLPQSLETNAHLQRNTTELFAIFLLNEAFIENWEE